MDKRCSIKKAVLKKICKSLFFNKNADLQACNFIKKKPEHKCFPVNIANYLRTPIL